MSEALIQYADLFYGKHTLAVVGCYLTDRRGPECEENVLVYPARGERKAVKSDNMIIEFIPTEISLGVPISHSEVIRDLDFKYNELVERDELRYYRRRLERTLKQAIKELVLSRRQDVSLRKQFIITAATYLADAYLLSKMIMPSPSHIYRQLDETCADKIPILSQVFEQNVAFGSLFLGRANMIRGLLNQPDNELFMKKFKDHFDNGRYPDANFYMMHSLQLLRENKTGSLHMLKFSAEDPSVEEGLILREIKVLTAKVL